MGFENACGYTAPAHQREVDAMLAAIRANPAVQFSISKASMPGCAPSGDALDQRLADELEAVRRRLDQIGDMLISDPTLLHRHAASLQGLDLADQMLVHLAAVVGALDKPAAVEAISMQDLKTRLKLRSTGR